MPGNVTLFHVWPSLCSQKVRLALAEKGLGDGGHVRLAAYYARMRARPSFVGPP